MNQNMWGDKQF